MKNFLIEEFDCPCCGANKMNKAFLGKLDEARKIANIPFIINSGYRCKEHNNEIGGSPTSSHKLGLAADIKIRNVHERFKILNALLKADFKRIGIYDTFIHVDNDYNKTQEVVW